MHIVISDIILDLFDTCQTSVEKIQIIDYLWWVICHELMNTKRMHEFNILCPTYTPTKCDVEGGETLEYELAAHKLKLKKIHGKLTLTANYISKRMMAMLDHKTPREISEFETKINPTMVALHKYGLILKKQGIIHLLNYEDVFHECQILFDKIQCQNYKFYNKNVRKVEAVRHSHTENNNDNDNDQSKSYFDLSVSTQPERIISCYR